MNNDSVQNSPRQLRRRPDEGMIAGVAAGFADFLGVDTVAVRLALVILAFAGGIAVPLYVAAWLLVPAAGAPCSIAEDTFHQWV